MISSVIYQEKKQDSNQILTFMPRKSVLARIIAAKIILLILLFFLGEFASQQLSSSIIAITAGLEFWITKNMGRQYLHAAWSIQTNSNEQDIWIYEASFKSPKQLQNIFWYSQIGYAVCLLFAAIFICISGKISLLCAVLVAFFSNYANFYAFSKIITLRNSGVLELMAEEAEVEVELRQTIKIPMVHQSYSTIRLPRNHEVKKSSLV